MGTLVLLFMAGAIPLVFVYVLFTNPSAILKLFIGIAGLLVVLGVGVGVLFGLFYLAASGGAA